MSQKTFIMIGLFVGSYIGGYIPTLFGVSLFSIWSLVGTTLGSFIGIIAAYKLTS